MPVSCHEGVLHARRVVRPDHRRSACRNHGRSTCRFGRRIRVRPRHRIRVGTRPRFVGDGNVHGPFEVVAVDTGGVAFYFPGEDVPIWVPRQAVLTYYPTREPA